MSIKSFGITRRLILATTAAMALCTAAWADAPPRVKFATSAGDFVVEVYPDKAPKTVENFLQYVRDKHYDGTVFHLSLIHISEPTRPY